MFVSNGVCGHTHSQRSREPPQMPLLSWKICPFCGLPMPVGGTQWEQLAQVFISAFWSIRPALPLCSTTLSLPCLVSTWLCSSALNPRRRQTPAYMNNLFFFFFFWGGGAKFLCPNDYWADFFLPSKSLFPPGSEPLRNAQNVGIVCFLLPRPHRTILLPSLFYALFYASAVGVKSFKDIERVACLISCF